jgi:hypothetical protein
MSFQKTGKSPIIGPAQTIEEIQKIAKDVPTKPDIITLCPICGKQHRNIVCPEAKKQ